MTKKILVALGPYPPIERAARVELEKFGQVDEVVGSLTEDDLVERIRDVNAVVLGAPKLTRKVILSANNLEVIARRGIGVDNIDLPAASEKGVVVTNCPGVLSSTVAEHTILLMLGISRKITVADRSVRTGRGKEFTSVLYSELTGKTLGVIGFGSIAIEVARIAKCAFRMKVITNDNRHIKRERVGMAGAELVNSLEELLRTSDYLVLTVPLSAETEGLIGEEQLNMMKPSSFFINVSRGKIVDEDALCVALQEHKIAGAALDVLVKQPPDPDNPLLKLDNVLFTPHCAALTIDTQRELSFACVEAISKLFSRELPDKPVNILNPEIASRYLERPLA